MEQIILLAIGSHSIQDGRQEAVRHVIIEKIDNGVFAKLIRIVRQVASQETANLSTPVRLWHDPNIRLTETTQDD